MLHILHIYLLAYVQKENHSIFINTFSLLHLDFYVCMGESRVIFSCNPWRYENSLKADLLTSIGKNIHSNLHNYCSHKQTLCDQIEQNFTVWFFFWLRLNLGWPPFLSFGLNYVGDFFPKPARSRSSKVMEKVQSSSKLLKKLTISTST
jgi:hypothetical protein